MAAGVDAKDEVRRFLEMALSKGNRPKAAADGPPPLKDVGFAKTYPVTWDYLTQTRWEDGSARLTATLLLFASEGILKGMLNDRDAQQTLWVASGTVMGVFAALEAALGDERADWRQDRRQVGDQARRSKKGT